ncbi:MAG: hypothetical protein N2690_01395 [Rhodocyclaceae bacterium]|nr:hypothetical protein [Rhodocyclaceae bacterium]
MLWIDVVERIEDYAKRPGDPVERLPECEALIRLLQQTLFLMQRRIDELERLVVEKQRLIDDLTARRADVASSIADTENIRSEP